MPESFFVQKTTVSTRTPARVQVGFSVLPDQSHGGKIEVVCAIGDEVFSRRRLASIDSVKRLQLVLDERVIIRLFVAEDQGGGVAAIIVGMHPHLAAVPTPDIGDIAGPPSRWAVLGLARRPASERAHPDDLRAEARDLLLDVVGLPVDDSLDKALDGFFASLERSASAS